MKRIILPLLSSLLLILFFPSCINDDLSDCETLVRVYIDYAHTLSDNAEPASRLDLFVFDSDGLFVGEWSDTNPVLDEDYYMELPLTPGSYYFVCYGGLEIPPYYLDPMASSCIKGETPIDTVRMSALRQSDGSVRNTLTSLYYGNLTEAEVVASSKNEFAISLIENTNRIYLTIGGAIDRSGSYIFRIEDANGDYLLDNSFASTSKLIYSSSMARYSSGVEGKLTVLRLARDRRLPVLSVLNGKNGTALYTGNLIDLILLLEEFTGKIDFDKTHDFYLDLVFDEDMNVGISLNGWRLAEQESAL